MPVCSGLQKAIGRLVNREGESLAERNKKHTLVAILLTMLVCGMTLMILVEKTAWLLIPYVLGFICSSTMLGRIIFLKELRMNEFLLLCLAYYVSVAILDIYHTVEGSEFSWTFFIIVLDLQLTLDVPKEHTYTLLVAIIIWFSTMQAEKAYRFGLLDLPGLPGDEVRRAKTDCENPPCKHFGGSLFLQLLVFLTDFYITRRFATRLRKERDRMQKSIVTTNQIASALSQYDLEEAEAYLIKAAHEIPPEIHVALDTLLSNLKAYRPYLPDALFEGMTVPPEYIGDIAPGLKNNTAAIAFTDIQGSTSTWEACPTGMREALKVHDDVLRQCISTFKGYEVKTIGDSFMAAFTDACDAVGFGLAVQVKLAYSAWPDELTEIGYYKWDETGPWCGLRVRIGVHFGTTTVELNPVTSRYDYFGTTVNMASRLESACIGGSVAVTADVLSTLPGEMKESLVIVQGGKVALKGITEMVSLVVLFPDSLYGRRFYAEQELQKPREQRVAKLTQDLEPIDTMSSVSSTMLHGKSDVLTRLPSISTAVVILTPSGGLDSERNLTDGYNSGVAKVVTCSERSDGTIATMQGSSIAVTWNAVKRCPSHLSASFRFVDHLLRLMPPVSCNGDLNMFANTGLSNGPTVHGTVCGGPRQRFITQVGKCSHLASYLSSCAFEHKEFCLYAGFHDKVSSLSPVPPSVIFVVRFLDGVELDVTNPLENGESVVTALERVVPVRSLNV